ncbi:MAG: hypothetical protein V1903_12640 [Bacteroidota bacterium]
MENSKPGIINGKLTAEIISLFLVVVIYALIIIKSLNSSYFWDNVQFTSKEAHWYYNSNFSSLLLPGFSEGSEIFGTGCHPPLIGIMTASLWNIFGKHLWVSHLLIALWAAVLIFSTWRLLRSLVPEVIAGFLLPVLLLDSTILSQLFIASPDIVLLASFVTTLLAVTERRMWLLTFALIFLVLINGRGAVTGIILFIFYVFHQIASDKKNLTPGLFFKSLIPFLPAYFLVSIYYLAYIVNFGWFFINPDSPWAVSGARPEGLSQVFKNLGAFCIRLAENGRFFIYMVSIILLIRLCRRNRLRSVFRGLNLSLGLIYLLFFFFFLYFAVTTTAVITSRYYMGMFFVINILLYRMMPELLSIKSIRIISVIALVFLITGNLWTYPDKISKAWDATLAHLPYYELREECLGYMAKNNYDLAQVSGGFCFKGNQRYFDLKDRDLYISERADNKYFIYSNISNIDDTFINELYNKGKWTEIRTFRKGFVTVSIYENRFYNETF